MLLKEPKGKVARVNTLYFVGCDLLCEKTHNTSLKGAKDFDIMTLQIVFFSFAKHWT